MRKLIGLTGPSSFTDECKELVEKYFQYNYVLLYHEDQNNLDEWLVKCDGFLIAGGVDIHPSIYDRDVINHQNLNKFDIKRDLREVCVIDYALKNKKPMLGICRGHQLIGLVLGMKADFCMDLSDSLTVHQPTKAGININKGEPVHSVEIITDNFTPGYPKERNILKDVMLDKFTKLIWTNSFHHQGIYYNPQGDSYYKSLGVNVIGISSADTAKNKFKIIEAMRGDTWISVQWHPEWDYEINTPSKTVLEIFKGML